MRTRVLPLSDTFKLLISTRTGLAFVAYWGIVLFGYDTCVPAFTQRAFPRLTHTSARGIAGGVVSQIYFETHFGIMADGKVNKAQDVTVSSNVVSVLQAGAFFGALGSAPLSGRRPDASHASRAC